MDLQVHIPDEEVDAISIRRMSQGYIDSQGSAWFVTLTHRFGSVLDKHGQILGPEAPHGEGEHLEFPVAFARALEDLRQEVSFKLALQNEAASRVGVYPKLQKSVDAQELLGLLGL